VISLGEWEGCTVEEISAQDGDPPISGVIQGITLDNDTITGITIVSVDVIKRLDAESIAGDEELSFLRVPDRESKHAAQVVDASVAVIFVKMKNRFGVAVSAIDVTTRFEVVTIICVVVDLAVVSDLE